MGETRSPLTVITPWYPTPTQPHLGIFIQGQTEALARLRKIRVLHFRSSRRWGRAELEEVSPGDRLATIEVSTPPGGWDFRRLRKLISDRAAGEGPFLIHTPALAAAVAPHRRGATYGVVLHGLDIWGARQSWSTRPLRSLIKEVLEGARILVAVSDRVRRQLPAHLADRCVVAHNGFDPAVFKRREAAASGATELVSVGNIGPRKGHDVVAQALHLLRRRGCSVRWRVIGEGPLRTALERTVQRLGLTDQVLFEGTLPPTDVAERLSKSAIFVLPAQYEAFGCVFIEAMAVGLGTIAGAGEGMEEVIAPGATGLLVEPDAEEVAVAIKGLVDHPDHLRNLGARASAFVHLEYTWDRRAALLNERLVEAGL